MLICDGTGRVSPAEHHPFNPLRRSNMQQQIVDVGRSLRGVTKQQCVSSTVHKHGKQKNDRQRNSNQPKQHAFPERHGHLHLINKWSDNAAAFHLFQRRNPLPGLMIPLI
jgi:hypothetical protein